MTRNMSEEALMRKTETLPFLTALLPLRPPFGFLRDG
jgi:hypothetical protein